jgi:hypothetical protein
MRSTRVLTHDTELHGVALAVTLHVRGDAGVIPRLLASHSLQSQSLVAHDDPAFLVRLDCLTLKYHRILRFNSRKRTTMLAL